MGFTDCVNIEWEFQKLWYSNSKNASKSGRDVHRVFNTLADFDFREGTNTPTETINVPDSATETGSGGATPSYHGGYVFEYENDPAETAIADGDDNSSDAAAQDIITTMSDQYESDNDKFADMGSYCVDIKRRPPARLVTVVTCGITMIQAQHQLEMMRQAFLGTRAEENGLDLSTTFSKAVIEFA